METETLTPQQRRVVSYVKPKYFNLLKKEVEDTKVSESRIVNEALKVYYDNKNKGSTLSKNSF